MKMIMCIYVYVNNLNVKKITVDIMLTMFLTLFSISWLVSTLIEFFLFSFKQNVSLSFIDIFVYHYKKKKFFEFKMNRCSDRN